MNNQQIRLLQIKLNQTGYRDQEGNKLAEDGMLGNKTTYALQQMLKNNGYTGQDGNVLATDGIWGPNTQAAYNKYIVSSVVNPIAFAVNGNIRVPANNTVSSTSGKASAYQQQKPSFSNTTNDYSQQTTSGQAAPTSRAGKDTRTWQSLLNSAGYRGKDGKKLIEDGIWGSNTEYAWQQYQNDKRNQSLAHKTTLTRQELDAQKQQRKLEAVLRADAEAQKTFATQQQTYDMQSVLNALGFSGLDGQPLRENGVVDLDTLVAWDKLRHSGNTMGNANSPIMQTIKQQEREIPEPNNMAIGLTSGTAASTSIVHILNIQKELNELGFRDYEGKPLKETGIMNSNTLFALNQKKVVDYIEENADISYFNNGKVWADLNSLQGIGITDDGTIIMGKQLDPLNEEMLRLKLEYMKPNSDKTKILKRINEIKSQRSDLNTVRYEEPLEYYRIVDITDRLNEIMKDAEEKYSYLADDQSIFKYLTFMFLVAPHMKYDLKRKEEFLAHSLYIYDGEIIDRDVLGNIVYGYLGRVMGISELPLYSVPGLEQVFDGTYDPNWGYSYFDDPRDQVRIMQGVNIYDSWH